MCRISTNVLGYRGNGIRPFTVTSNDLGWPLRTVSGTYKVNMKMLALSCNTVWTIVIVDVINQCVNCRGRGLNPAIGKIWTLQVSFPVPHTLDQQHSSCSWTSERHKSLLCILALWGWQQGRCSHRSWRVMTPTFRGKGGRGDIIWE